MSCKPFMCGGDPSCPDRLCEGHPANTDAPLYATLRASDLDGGMGCECALPEIVTDELKPVPAWDWQAIAWFACFAAILLWICLLSTR